MRLRFSYFFCMKTILPNLKANLKSGITVSLVSLPLSISLAIAGGATPIMGVITAIWAGLFAALFAGSNYNIVGPTGALSGLLAVYAMNYGIGVLPILAIIGGIIILISYFFKVDKYIVFIPSSVIHGFTLGVACIIGFNQLNFATGLKGLPTHERFIENVIESFKHITSASGIALGIFLITLALLFVFLKKLPKIPGPIVVSLFGIILGYLSTNGILHIPLQTLFSKYGDLKATLFAFPHIGREFLNFELWKAAAAIAIIAILETLISAKIADKMTKTKFDRRREMFGLGLANIASGICGGIPATAALARTALNIKSGATHKASAFINAISVMIISLLLLGWFRYLPLPIVAAILVYVAIRMVESEHFSHLYKHDKVAFGLSLVVAAITIVEDPIIGILVGSVIALLIFISQLAKGQAEITFNKNKKVVERMSADVLAQGKKIHADVAVYRFAGQLSYVNATSHAENLEKITDIKTLILSFRNLFFTDVDGIEALGEIIENLERKNQELYITGVPNSLRSHIRHAPWYKKLEKNGRIFDSTTDALQTLGFQLLKI